LKAIKNDVRRNIDHPAVKNINVLGLKICLYPAIYLPKVSETLNTVINIRLFQVSSFGLSIRNSKCGKLVTPGKIIKVTKNTKNNYDAMGNIYLKITPNLTGASPYTGFVSKLSNSRTDKT